MVFDRGEPDLVGRQLCAYLVEGRLGAGGLGEVYRARDTKLGRNVAIKVLPLVFTSDPERLARFEREARVLASLNHPHIGAIYGVEDTDGMRALVLELVDGQTLAELIARQAGNGQGLPMDEALSIARQISDALDAAHAKGIVHRDLKPANVKITRDGVVKILDFGLAKTAPADVAGGGLSQSPTVAIGDTREGVILGTAAYMSPEQARGRPVDKRADIWAFGCVLYELLTGRVAFGRETASDTIAAILDRQPDWSALPSATSPRVRLLLQRCLEKDAARRLRDIGDAAADLASPMAANAAAEAVPGTFRRNALWLAAGVAAVLGLAIFAATQMGRVDKPAGSIAVLPFANASGNTDMDYLSDGITESLINSLSQVPNLAVMSRNSVFRYKGRETDAQAAGRALDVPVVLAGTVAQHGDSLSISAELIDVRNNRHLWGEQYNRKLLDILAVQQEISTEITNQLRFKLTGEEKKRITRQYTQNIEAYQLYLRGRYHWKKVTPEGFTQGIEYFQKAIAVDPNYAPAYAALAAVYNNLANYNFELMLPKDAWTKAKSAAEKALEIDDRLASAHASLALVAYQWEWDWPAAEKEFKRALELDPSSPSTYEPSPSSTYHWYAHFLMTMGRREESLAAANRALELDPLDLPNNAHQGWHYIFIRQYDKAIEPLQKTLELNPNFSIARWYLGLTYEQQGGFEEAVAEFEQSVRLTGGLPSMVALLGHAYAVQNRAADAQAILRQLIARSQKEYVPPYPVAVIYAALGQKDDAFAWLEKAYDERDSWMDYLGLDPRLDGLRSDPRFADLLRRMKLPS